MPPPMRKTKRFRRRLKPLKSRRMARGFGAAAELRALMDAAVDAIVVIDERGDVVSFSPAAESMFGYESAEIVGRPIHELMPEPYRSEHAAYMRRYHETGERRIIGVGREAKARRRNGEVFPVWLSVGEAASISGRRYVGIIRDLTEQREAERQRHVLENRLAHVGRLSLMGEMATGIAHEINQPLSAISNYSQAARHLLEGKDFEPDALRSACRGIAEEVQRAGRVLENLRSFVRRREIESEPLDLNQMIEGALTLVSADSSSAGVTVYTHFDRSLPMIRGNVVQLQQVLLNLTHNAVDAVRDGLSHRRVIQISTSQPSASTVEFRVADRGPGVSDGLAEAIFHPFVTTKPEGLGVGLAISRSIIEAHGGRLAYENHPEGGAVFVVTLPIEPEDNERG